MHIIFVQTTNRDTLSVCKRQSLPNIPEVGMLMLYEHTWYQVDKVFLVRTDICLCMIHSMGQELFIAGMYGKTLSLDSLQVDHLINIGSTTPQNR